MKGLGFKHHSNHPCNHGSHYGNHHGNYGMVFARSLSYVMAQAWLQGSSRSGHTEHEHEQLTDSLFILLLDQSCYLPNVCWVLA